MVKCYSVLYAFRQFKTYAGGSGTLLLGTSVFSPPFFKTFGSVGITFIFRDVVCQGLSESPGDKYQYLADSSMEVLKPLISRHFYF